MIARTLIVAEMRADRTRLEGLCRDHISLELVGSLRATEELPQAFDDLEPEVVVFAGSGRPEHDGGAEIVLSAWRDASLASPSRQGPGLVLLAEELDPDQVACAVRRGSFAWLPPDASAQEIQTAIEAVLAGLVVLHPSFVDAAAAPRARRRTSEIPPLPGTTLTAREVEVLRLIAAGLANKEIAVRLEISDHTVKFHIASIFNKLDVSNRAQAVSSGLRQGLIMV